MKKRASWKRYLSLLVVSSFIAGTMFNVQAKAFSLATNYGVANDIELQPAGEYGNPDLTFNIQPESSYWFPSQLLEWKAEDDKDLSYNKSTVLLASRAGKDLLKPVNETQNKDTKVLSISIMNANTSGNLPNGSNNVNCNTFSYWQYVDTLVYWGGSSGEGLIVAPSPDVVDAGHKNGVKVTGTIFFPQKAHGGKLEWLNDFLQKDDKGEFPIVDKLIEVADTYGFDGWFLNQETEGTTEEPLTKEHSKLTQEFIRDFKDKAPHLELIYYDSMTDDGKMDWQNALTDANVPFMKDEGGKRMADSMFLNFWWTEDKLAGKELLKASAQKAKETGIDPYSVYAGIDIQSNGYLTPIRWNLLEQSKNSTYTSIGLYCPNWAYTSASDMEDFWNKENAIWVNSKGDPSQSEDIAASTKWRGISKYVIERTAITKLPFTTNFCIGNGYSYFKNGQQVSNTGWNNRSLSDIMPTYRWIIQDEGANSLTAGLDMEDAYYGGSSLNLKGNMVKGNSSTVKLYSADLPVTKDVVFTTTAKSNTATKLYAVVELEDGTTEVLTADKEVGQDWVTLSYDISSLAGKSIQQLSYQISTQEDNSGYELNLGNITIAQKQAEAETVISDFKVDDKEFDLDATYAGVRLSWKVNMPAEYYEIYNINENGTKSLLGVSNKTNFYINGLPRSNSINSVFEVVPVRKMFLEGNGVQTRITWPDNRLPRADFTADKTIAAPGEVINFTSLCSSNTDSVTWSFIGADKEVSDGDTVAVSYPKEGVYDVKVIAKNDSGNVEKVSKGHIVISAKAANGLELLSLGADAQASSYVNEKEAPKFAVDGDITSKWCATGSAPHTLTIDLGEIKFLSAADISHAEAGGENHDMNTKAYSISVSEDGLEYSEVINIMNNTKGVTHDSFAPVKGRFVKLILNKPTQGTDSAARIYEVEVFGLNNM